MLRLVVVILVREGVGSISRFRGFSGVALVWMLAVLATSMESFWASAGVGTDWRRRVARVLVMMKDRQKVMLEPSQKSGVWRRFWNRVWGFFVILMVSFYYIWVGM
jgi:hypothetical protein